MGPFQLNSPTWWVTVAGLVLSVIGVSDPGMQADVKSVIGGGAAIIIAVYTHEHHKTQRNLDTATATVATANATVAVAQAATVAGSVVIGPVPGATQVLPLPIPAGSTATDNATTAAASTVALA